MEIIFDISKDEVPIFLAEVDEHLQVLDNSLVRMEREEPDPELVQTVFRSAHTIKGMSGMIGHRRMTELTHTLETILDGVRNNSIKVSPQLVNCCLEAVDCLRLLRGEVATLQVSSVDIDEIVLSLKDLMKDGTWQEVSRNDATKTMNTVLLNDKTIGDQNVRGHVISTSVNIDQDDAQCRGLQIQAKIETSSMASAARAFQIMMALQDLGEIQSMTPTQEQIETATSISDVSAILLTDQSIEKVSKSLMMISEIDEISINGELILSSGLEISKQPQKVVSEQSAEPAKMENNPSLPAKAFDPILNEQVHGKRAPDSIGRRISDLTFRMNVERMDNLMNLVGELITDRNHLQQLRSQIAAETSLNNDVEQLFETIIHLGRITDQLQEEVMSIRMLPLGSVFSRFPRLVHDMSRKVGKLINMVVQGEETEMDRSLIDEIYDPLIHLIRNSVDHGIESPQERLAAGKPERGTIKLTARHEQGRIILTVEDDGRGIDREKLRQKAIQKGLISTEEAAALTEAQSIDLMFLAGLSTSEKVTELSGRGVGLDIVKTNIQRINGSVQAETWLGQGTQFQIVLPLTLAIVPSLLVKIQQATFAIPMVMISETVRLENSEIKSIWQKPVILLRGSVLTLIHLSDVFNMPRKDEERQYLFAVVIKSGKERVGLIVDSLIGEEEVVVKPLGSFVGDIPGISSATILGNGQVALIVDVFNLFKLAGV
jgi:Chemotaxis protein histidine kinase and related kinases